jgi:AcrR family transcriptional regulator
MFSEYPRRMECQQLVAEQRSPATARAAYRMTKRAHQVDETRRRIVAATAGLHGTVGPAKTTVSGIAEAAGVTRVTVYRHFPDEAALFAACTSHWTAQQRMPDVAGWREIPVPEDRATAALTDLYRFFRDAEPMLTLTSRDRDVLPDFVHARNQQTTQTQIDALLQAWPPRQRTKRRRALIGHAMSFGTWRSLCVDQALPQQDAVGAMTRLVVNS